MTVYDLDRLRAAVSARLPQRRLAHVLSVEGQMTYLAQLLLPQEMLRLRAAALLHDIAKDIPDEEQPALCDALGISLTEAERATPPILHAKSGAVIAARDFPAFTDPEILRAIRLHTTGASGMTLFERMLMAADFSEPRRQWDRCQSVRQKIMQIPRTAPLDERRRLFDRAFLYMLEVKYDYIATTGTVWNDQTQQMLDDYRRKFAQK